MKGLVFSGGGAKGSYEVGCVKALEKLKMDYDVVCGTSIGSVNATLYVLGGYKLMHKFFTSSKVKDLFDIENINELAENDYNKAIAKVTGEVIKQNGLSTNAFYKKLKDNINEDKLRKSKKKLGYTVFNVTKMKGEEIYLDNIEKGKVADYILASCSCFPILKGTQIDDAFYIDGSYSNYMPIDIALNLGADDILAIDLKAPGIKKPIKDSDTKKVKLTYITPSKDVGDMIVFTKKDVERNITLGYNDTMKTFGKAFGSNILIDDKTYNYIISNVEKLHLDNELKYIEKDIKENPIEYINDMCDFIYDHIKNNNELINKYANKILDKHKLRKLLFKKYLLHKQKIDIDFNNIKEVSDIELFAEQIKSLGKNYKEILVSYVFDLYKENKKDTARDNNKLKTISVFLKREIKLSILMDILKLK